MIPNLVSTIIPVFNRPAMLREAVASGRLKGSETLPATVTLTVGGVNLSHTIEGTVELA